MTATELLEALPDAMRPGTLPAREVTSLCVDSRTVTPGCLFVCIPGVLRDGREFAGSARSEGALLLVGQGDPPAGIPPSDWIRVPDARRAVARLACRFHGDPSHRLEVFGVTGTNGKTTVATVLRTVLEGAGTPCGLLSTVENHLGDRTEPAAQTTPDATVLQAHLSRMLHAGCAAVCMEVSSHALSQHRTEGIRFAAAAFTNLTREHLDYHGTMESYGLAKRRLFEQLRENPKGLAVVNQDDPWGRTLLEWLRESAVASLTYGFDGTCDVRAEGIRLDSRSSRFRLASPWGSAEVMSPLLGRHNVSNLLAVAAMASRANVSVEAVAALLAQTPCVRGRLERIPTPHHPASLFVDYAHTPDALHHALKTLREIARGRLIVVFGCGGERDRGKRPRMGELAHRRADLVVLTSDNPRGESPAAILDEILGGIPPRSAKVLLEPDRRRALQAALEAATGPDDVVLVAGKGHETEQLLADRRIPFDDREELLQMAERLFLERSARRRE